MNHPIRYFFISILFLFAVAFFAQHSFALVPILKTDLDKIDVKTLSCAIIGTNIDKKITNFNASKTAHLEIYTKLVDRINQMLEKWQDWGYDTDEIEDDMEVIEDKIGEYKSDHAVLITKLTDAKNACGTSNYNLKVTQAKEALKEVRKDVVNLRVFYQTELRKDIVDLKAQELN